MTRRKQRQVMWRPGWISYHPEAAQALTSPYAAAALEAIDQRADNDGWAEVTDDQLAQAVGCTRGTIPQIRAKLIKHELVEAHPGRLKRTRYRLLEAADSFRYVPQMEAAAVPQNAAADPLAERDRGSSNGSHPLPPDVEGDLDQDLESDPRASSLPVAREPEGGGGGVGPSLRGKAEKGSLSYAFRLLALRRPEQCEAFLLRLDQGCAQDDKVAWARYNAEDYGLELDLAEYIQAIAEWWRNAPADERGRIRHEVLERAREHEATAEQARQQRAARVSLGTGQ